MRPISRFCTPGSILWVLEKTPQTNPWPERRANPCERNSVTTTGSAFGKGLSIVEGCHLQFGTFSQLLKDALYGLLCSLNYWKMHFTVFYFQSIIEGYPLRFATFSQAIIERCPLRFATFNHLLTDAAKKTNWATVLTQLSQGMQERGVALTGMPAYHHWYACWTKLCPNHMHMLDSTWKQRQQFL